MNRRQFVSGSVGLAIASALARAEAAEVEKKAIATSVIVLWMNGGPSHLDTWDPKRGKVAGPGKAIRTSVPGVSISEHLPEVASLAHKLAIVRGMTTKEGNHQRAQYLLRTGYAPTPTVAHPTIAAWMSRRLDHGASGLPFSVSLGGPSLGAGFFGVEHAPFVVVKPGQMPDNVGYGPGVDAARFQGRLGLLAKMDDAFAGRIVDPKIGGRRAVVEKANSLMHAKAISAFDASAEPETVRKAFGDTAFGGGCLTAVRLVAAGVKFVEVTLDGWDTHQDNFGRSAKLMGAVDPAMASLLRELDRRGLDRTLVVWMGEFGRTPRINANDGRDHHPNAFSVVLAGAGIRKGTVVGETDDEGAKVVKDPCTVPNLLATVANVVGLEPGDTAMSPAGRPISLTDNGTPVRALVAEGV